ncbi:hypothetical protein MRU69_02570 [Kocuria flava]|uniref:hypothetical protein n=1 Tax=Kocuria flava TaxID=446860 RepID=UPI001FF4FB39|nr:hypothetical protein [Kocuria flava]MCJ8503749.1 hypothetical protein [Kocuria flava]
MTTLARRTTARAGAAALVAVAGLGLAGCSSEGPETGTDVEDVSEGEVLESSPTPDNDPTAGDTFVGNYDQDFYDERETYVGQEVTLSAEVGQVIDDDAFVLAGTAENTVDPLLVLYDMDRVDIEEGQVVQVTGTVQEAFDLPTVEDEKQKDLEDDLYADHDQQPYIDATDVMPAPQE